MDDATGRDVAPPDCGSPSDYQARKLSDRCTRPGCKRVHSESSSLCVKHHRAAKKAARKSMAKMRAERGLARICIWCPKDDQRPATPGSPTCLRCRTRHNAIRSADGVFKADVNQRRAARILTATSKDPDGRSRYRGQKKRGQQPREQLIDQDLHYARERLDAAANGYAAMRSDEAKLMPRIQREDVGKAADSHVVRAIDHLNEALGRRGHRREYPEPTPTGLPDPDDDDATLSYKRASDAARVAAAARAGLYVYAPPLDVTSGRRETGKDPKPPDLEPLRRGLAERGLGLVDEGAFYWMITEQRQGRRDGDT